MSTKEEAPVLKLILGRAGTGKSTLVLERIREGMKTRPQILIVPENMSHESERALAMVCGPQGCLRAEALTFTLLSNRVLQAAGCLQEEELDGGGRLLLMYQAVKETAAGLQVYGRPSRRPAFLESLLETSDELKTCRLTPEQLVDAGEVLGGADGSRLRDLGLICGTYDSLTRETALDPVDRLTRTAEKLKELPWARGMDIWLDGFLWFTPQQVEVVRQLLVQANSVTAALTCDTLDGQVREDDVFAPMRMTGRILRETAALEQLPVETEHLENTGSGRNGALQYLERNLFDRTREQPVSSAGAVELWQAEGLYSEVERAAARILHLVREDGYRFRDIGVVARNYGAYRTLIETIFPRYGVPVFSSAMTDILEKPVMALVTSALDAAAGGYRYEDMFRYLKTGLTDIPQEDIDLLENYVIKWNIRGSRWTQKKPWNWNPEGFDPQLTDENRELLQHLDRVRRRAVAPLERLVKGTVHTGRGQAEALFAFLEDIGLPDRLADRVRALRARRELVLAEEYRQLWDILCSGLEQCAGLLEETPMELDEFARLFRMVLSQYTVGTIPVSLDRVTAGETGRQVGHRVKVLLLLGADDATIPMTSKAPGLLTDEDRTCLASMGHPMGRSSRDLLYMEMTTVYLVCAQPSDRLIVSWPSHGPGGEDRRPCFLVDRLRNLFPDLLIEAEEQHRSDSRLEAPLPALSLAGRSPEVRQALAGIPGWEQEIQRLEAAGGWERGRLSREAVDELYGTQVPMSASRMDKFKSCHFSYFMNYGLKAQPRKPAGFQAPEYGTFVHYVLEHVLQHPDYLAVREDLKDEAKKEEAMKTVRRLTGEVMDTYAREELGGLEGQTERFLYLFRRLLRPVQSVVENTVEELSVSDFQPVDFELGFAKDGKMPPVELEVDGLTISITGFVDRVDGWVKDGRLYLRVADYKTGRKSFDFTDVFNGLGLQMLLYLFTLEERGEKLYGLPVDGAGVLYVPAREITTRGTRLMAEEDRLAKVNKELTRSGLVLDDPDVLEAMEHAGPKGLRFLPLKVKKDGTITGSALASAENLGRLGKHIQKILNDIGKELAEGSIASDPFWKGEQKNACMFCDYAAACQFEERRGTDCRRWLRHMEAPDFWDSIAKEVEGSAPGKA